MPCESGYCQKLGPTRQCSIRLEKLVNVFSCASCLTQQIAASLIKWLSWWLQAFTEAAVREYVPLMLDITRQKCDAWAAADEVIGWSQSHAYAFHIAAAILIGGDWDAAKLQEMQAHFESFTLGLYTPPLDFPGTLYHKGKKAREAILAEVEGADLACSLFLHVV